MINESGMQDMGLPNFTNKEKAVLRLISNNMTTHQIADQMNVSESTVKNHRHNICRKLDLSPVTNALLHWVLVNKDAFNF